MTDEEALSLPYAAPVMMRLKTGTVRTGFLLGTYRSQDGRLHVNVEHPYEIQHTYIPAQIERRPLDMKGDVSDTKCPDLDAAIAGAIAKEREAIAGDIAAREWAEMLMRDGARLRVDNAMANCHGDRAQAFREIAVAIRARKP